MDFQRPSPNFDQRLTDVMETLLEGRAIESVVYESAHLKFFLSGGVTISIKTETKDGEDGKPVSFAKIEIEQTDGRPTHIINL